jgi:dipeptidyl aminopeptidase/acylaminoacyl peptidase
MMARIMRAGYALFFAACAGSIAVAEDQPIVTSDLLRMRSVTSIDVSASGARAVYAVRSIAERTRATGAADDADDAKARGGRHTYRSHLWTLDLVDATASARQLTHGDRTDEQPVVAPDGTTIAFVRAGEALNDAGEPVTQIWLLDLRGGEARQVTTFENGAGSPRWSPDGTTLLVSSDLPRTSLEGRPDWEMERPRREWNDADGVAEPRPDGSRAEIRAWLEANASANAPFVINRIEFQGEHALEGEMTFSHLFLVDPADPAAEPRRLTTGFRDHRDAVFVDRDTVCYVTTPASAQHLDRVLQRELRLVELDGTGDRALLSLPGWQVGSPRPNARGTMIAFTAEQLDEPAYRQQRLGMIALDGETIGQHAWVTDPASLDRSVRNVHWMNPRGSVVFTTADRGGFPIMTVAPGLLEPVALLDRQGDHPVGVHAMATGGGAIVYSVTTPKNPCTLWVSDGGGDRIAHDLNAWVRGKRLSEPTEHWVSRPDGLRVQYWVMEPTNREPGKRYPLALQIHGGPSAMWGPGESSMWHEFQLLCSWGYGVVFANPRGSGGYGYDFQKANFQDWGAGPMGDVLAAVDQVLFEDWVDQDRLVMTGGSYAGYLTAWIVGHDNRFRAAVAQRGVYDLATFFGEGNAWRLNGWAMGGFPWEPATRRVMQRESPFSYVDRIRTPLLIMHGSRDLRTGVSQSEMLYRGLKQLGRDVEYVRYPEAGHDLSRDGDPTMRMDRLNRIIEFFERHIENPRPAPREIIEGPGGE